MEIIGDSTNTLAKSFMWYYKHNIHTVRLDLQITQDKKIAISNDDCSMKRMKHLLRENTITLDEYLRHIPGDLNIILNMTRKFGGKQNALPNDVVCRIIMATKKRGKKNVIYASSDFEMARIVTKNKRDALFIITEECQLSQIDIFSKICIDPTLLDLVASLSLTNKNVYVHNVSYTHYEELKSRYPFIAGLIVDDLR